MTKTHELNLLQDEYVVVKLNIPHLDGNQVQLCKLMHNKMKNFYLAEKEKLDRMEGSSFSPLFLGYNRNQDQLEPILDEFRFHCENILENLDYTPSITLRKDPPMVMSENNEMQYIMDAAKDITVLLGGKGMK